MPRLPRRATLWRAVPRAASMQCGALASPPLALALRSRRPAGPFVLKACTLEFTAERARIGSDQLAWIRSLGSGIGGNGSEGTDRVGYRLDCGSLGSELGQSGSDRAVQACVGLGKRIEPHEAGRADLAPDRDRAARSCFGFREERVYQLHRADGTHAQVV